MPHIKLTSKRQATFPRELCKELDIQAGDELLLERKKIEGKISWVLRVPKNSEAKWFGALKKYAQNKSHDMDAIRQSIGRSIGKGPK